MIGYIHYDFWYTFIVCLCNQATSNTHRFVYSDGLMIKDDRLHAGAPEVAVEGGRA